VDQIWTVFRFHSSESVCGLSIAKMGWGGHRKVAYYVSVLEFPDLGPQRRGGRQTEDEAPEASKDAEYAGFSSKLDQSGPIERRDFLPFHPIPKSMTPSLGLGGGVYPAFHPCNSA
jgi:hypothetical protein